MKQLQKVGLVAVLILALTGSALAGDIPIGKDQPPPPPPSASTTTSGEIPSPTGDTEDADSANRLLEEIALDLFQILLSVI